MTPNIFPANLESLDSSVVGGGVANIGVLGGRVVAPGGLDHCYQRKKKLEKQEGGG